MHVHRTCFVLDCFNTSCRCETSHNKPHNWHANSSRGSVMHLSRERNAPRNLEPNLSQMLHSVQFISKLTIFICKQLKRPVAFNAVHQGLSNCFHDVGPTVALSLVFIWLCIMFDCDHVSWTWAQNCSCSLASCMCKSSVGFNFVGIDIICTMAQHFVKISQPRVHFFFPSLGDTAGDDLGVLVHNEMRRHHLCDCANCKGFVFLTTCVAMLSAQCI